MFKGSQLYVQGNMTLLRNKIVATLQNFIHKDTVDLENVQGNKKKEKGEFIGHQI
jgi:hypothetical protein